MGGGGCVAPGPAKPSSRPRGLLGLSKSPTSEKRRTGQRRRGGQCVGMEAVASAEIGDPTPNLAHKRSRSKTRLSLTRLERAETGQFTCTLPTHGPPACCVDGAARGTPAHPRQVNGASLGAKVPRLRWLSSHHAATGCLTFVRVTAPSPGRHASSCNHLARVLDLWICQELSRPLWSCCSHCRVRRSSPIAAQ